MPSRTNLSGPEQDLILVLREAAEESRPQPRASFAASLRDQLVAQAQENEAREAEAFQLALEGKKVKGQFGQLVAFASALQATPQIVAPGSLRYQLRAQLGSSSNVVGFGSRTRSRTARKVNRFALAAAISAMMVSTSAFAFAASANDTPADSLYGLKKFRERAQTWFISGTDEGLRRLRFAGFRVDETQVMIDRGVTESAPYQEAFNALQTELGLASELILEGHRGGDPLAADAMPRLAQFLTVNLEKVSDLAEAVPEGARPAAADALTVLESAAEKTEQVVGGCVLCSPNPLVPSSEPPPCETCPPTQGQPDRPGILPRPRSSGNPEPNDPGKEPDKKPVPPVPTAAPTPLPDPDRVPDLPGRLDDDLEGPVSSLIKVIISMA